MSKLKRWGMAVFLALYAPGAWAQTGALLVRAFDAANNPVEGVELEFTNRDSKFKTPGTTSAKGSYNHRSLPYGTYDISARKENYAVVEISYSTDADNRAKMEAAERGIPLEKRSSVGFNQALPSVYVGPSFTVTYRITLATKADAEEIWRKAGAAAPGSGKARELTAEQVRDVALLEILDKKMPFAEALPRLQKAGGKSAEPESIATLGSQYYVRNGQLEDAEAALKYAGEKGFSKAWIYLGDIETTAGRHAEAAAAYQKALEKNPGGFDLLVALAQSQEAQGLKAEAAKSYEAASQADAKRTEPLAKLVELYTALGKHADAKITHQKLQALEGTSGQGGDHVSHFNAAVVCQNSGDMACAKKEFLAALELNPSYKRAHYEVGMLYVNENKCKEAVKHFEAFLALKPGAGDGDVETAKSLLDYCKSQK